MKFLYTHSIGYKNFISLCFLLERLGDISGRYGNKIYKNRKSAFSY